MKTHWRKLVNPHYLGAYSLGDLPEKTYTIVKVVREMVSGTGGKSEECTVAYIEGDKPLILNSTNSKIIQSNYNTPFIEDWAGKMITVYVAHIKAFGEDNVEALRIRKKKDMKPELNPGHQRWEGAKKAIKDGNTTIAEIENVFIITPENKQKLCGNSNVGAPGLGL